MSDCTSRRVTTETPIGDDVDRAQEDARLVDGTRFTPEVAQNIVEQARRAVGRPSRSGKAATSPQIAFRVATTLRDRAAAIAAQEGKTLSQLAREALESGSRTRGKTRSASARVSTVLQDSQLQRDALEVAGCVRVFEEKVSTRSTARPGLAQALDCPRRTTATSWRCGNSTGSVAR